MAYDIGLKVGVEGEKEFKQALRDLNSDMKVLGSEATLVASQFDKQDKSVEAVAARQKVLNAEIDKQKQKIDVLKKALKNAADTYGENDTKTRNWQVQLNKAEAELNNMQKELSQTTDGAKDYAKATDDMSCSTADVGEGFSKAKISIAAVGAAITAAVAAITKATVELGKALVEMSVGGAAYADTVMTEATVTGIATDKLQEYMYAAELVDVSTETLTGSMTKNIRSMKSAADGSTAFVEAYETLGISIRDAEGNLRNGDDVYWELIEALGEMDNETERDAIAMQLLGKSARDLNPLITAGAERMKELGKEAQASGYVLSTDTLEAYGKFDDQLQYLKVNSEGAKNAIGTVLLPALSELAVEGNGLLTQFTNGIKDANGDVDKMSEVLSDTMTAALSVISERIPEVVNLIGQIAESVVQALVDNLPQILESVLEIADETTDQLTALLPQLAKGIIQLLKGLMMMISDALPDLIEALIDVIVDVFAGDGFSQLINGMFTVLEKLLERLPDIILKLVEGIPKIVGGFVDGLLENLPVLVSGIILLITKLVAYTPEFVVEIVKSIPIIIEGIATGFVEMGAKFFEIGKGIIDGIEQGFADGWQGFKDKIKNFFSDIGSFVKDLLGIHSPSKVYAEIGDYMAQGIGVGFEDEMGNVERQMQASIPTDFDISARANLPSVMSDYGSQAQISEATSATTYEAVSQTDLLREQNELLKQILAKSFSINISNREIGEANEAYINSKGLNLA